MVDFEPALGGQGEPILLPGALLASLSPCPGTSPSDLLAASLGIARIRARATAPRGLATPRGSSGSKVAATCDRSSAQSQPEALQFSKLNGWRSRNREKVLSAQNHVRSNEYGVAAGPRRAALRRA